MDTADFGPLYAEVGQVMADDLWHDQEGSFMYVEDGDGYVDCSIFKDLGDRVLYRDCSARLSEKIW
jgi:hypothetical protein